MLTMGHLFIIEEGIYADTKDSLSKYFEMNSVKEFINLSQRFVKDGVKSFTDQEQKTYRGLFDDPSVQDYITAARRAGERDGWVFGGLTGGGIGSLSGLGLGGAIGGAAGSIIFAILGAAAGGFLGGLTLSKVMSWLRKWKAEDDVIKLGKVGGVFGKTTPIVRAD